MYLTTQQNHVKWFAPFTLYLTHQQELQDLPVAIIASRLKTSSYLCSNVTNTILISSSTLIISSGVPSASPARTWSAVCCMQAVALLFTFLCIWSHSCITVERSVMIFPLWDTLYSTLSIIDSTRVLCDRVVHAAQLLIHVNFGYKQSIILWCVITQECLHLPNAIRCHTQAKSEPNRLESGEANYKQHTGTDYKWEAFLA